MVLVEVEGYEMQRGGYFKEGRQMTNFVIAADKIPLQDEISPEIRMELRGETGLYTLHERLCDILNKQFLQGAPVIIEDKRAFYKAFRSAILRMDFGEDNTYYCSNKNGIQEIDRKLWYVFSNGSIYRNGFSAQVFSGRERIYIPKDSVIDLDPDAVKIRNAVAELLEIFDCNARVFYPLFFLNLAAICNGYFRMLGEREFMKITIWMDGDSGSGKTELAKAVGTFVFADEFLNSNLLNATGRMKNIIDRLRRSSGSVFILDDIKKEKVRDRSNRVVTIVDDVLRGVFQGMLTDGSGQFIDVCALITGEYVDTLESLNARMLYLKVNHFIKEARSSEALHVLQGKPLLLTQVCCSFIQWFLRRTEETSFSQLLLQKLEVMRGQGKEYKGIGNAERLNENIRMLNMAKEIAAMFFRDIDLPEELVRNFTSHAEDSIKSIGDDTYILLGGEKMALLKVAENILSKCKLRKARFVEDIRKEEMCQYQQIEFMLHEGDDFVYIEDMKKSLQLSTDNGHDQYDSYPYLLGRERHVLGLFMDETEHMQQEGQMSQVVAEGLLRNLPQKLKKAQIIYKRYRADNAWGRTAVKYPVCNYMAFHPIRREGVDYATSFGNTGMVDFEPVIQMNTMHSSMDVLRKRLKQGKFIDKIPPLLSLQYGDTNEMEVYKARTSFIVGKSLYRE